MSIILVVILVIINIPVYGILATMLFGRKGGFRHALQYLFVPPFVSALKGEFWDDMWAKERLIIWLGLCAIVVISEYKLIEENLPFVIEFLPY
jgi:hypothetical protein